MLRRSESGYVGIAVLIVMFINVTIGGLATEYVFETWVGYFKLITVDVPFWKCALAGLFLGEITIPLAIMTFIIMPFL